MRPAADLLLAEAEALPVVLARCSPADLERPSVLPGWSIRDVLAHCAAALGHLVAGDELDFSAEANQADVDVRRSWPIERVVAELYDVYDPAATLIDAAGGRFDGLGLGEWVHGGDVRAPLGEPDAYASAGVDLAIPLLVERSRQRESPGVVAHVDGQRFDFGVGAPRGEVRTDTATFVRLCAGRSPDPASYELVAVREAELLLFS